MKRFAAMIAIVGLVASASFAGTVEFDPANFEYDRTNPPPSIEIQVTLNSDLGMFDSTNVAIGSSDGLNIAGFAYSQAFIDATLFQGPVIPEPSLFPVFPSNLTLGGFALAAINTPIVLGTLTVTLPNVAGGLVDGDEFSFQVDTSLDGGFSSIGLAADIETLLGGGMITIVPEPATLCLLGLGAIGLVRRRFA